MNNKTNKRKKQNERKHEGQLNMHLKCKLNFNVNTWIQRACLNVEMLSCFKNKTCNATKLDKHTDLVYLCDLTFNFTF